MNDPITGLVAAGRYQSAAGILAGADGAAGATPQIEHSSLALLLPSNPFNLDSLVPNLIGGLTAWILSHIEPINEALEQLAGDPDSVQATLKEWEKTHELLAEHPDAMVAMNDTLTATWSGPAASAFLAHGRAERECAQASLAAMKGMMRRLVDLSNYTVHARAAVVAIAGRLIGELVDAALSLVSLPFQPWRWQTALAEFAIWALDLIANTMRRIANLLQDVVAQGTELLGQLSGIGQDFSRATAVLLTGTDPGRQGDSGPGAGRDIQGETRPSDRELMMVTDGNPMPDNYHLLSDKEVADLGIDPALLRNKETGFGARIVRGPNQELLVVFEGTDFTDPADVAEDGAGIALLTGQSADTVRLTDALARTSEANNVVYLGHSLGGRLAAIASMNTGNGAVTFNAAGVSPATIDYFARRNGVDPTEFRHRLQNGQVRLYTTKDDPLTVLQEGRLTGGTAPDAVGLQYRLGGDHNIVTEAADGHLMHNVIKEFGKWTPQPGDSRLNRE